MLKTPWLVCDRFWNLLMALFKKKRYAKTTTTYGRRVWETLEVIVTDMSANTSLVNSKPPLPGLRRGWRRWKKMEKENWIVGKVTKESTHVPSAAKRQECTCGWSSLLPLLQEYPLLAIGRSDVTPLLSVPPFWWLLLGGKATFYVKSAEVKPEHNPLGSCSVMLNLCVFLFIKQHQSRFTNLFLIQSVSDLLEYNNIIQYKNH